MVGSAYRQDNTWRKPELDYYYYHHRRHLTGNPMWFDRSGILKKPISNLLKSLVKLCFETSVSHEACWKQVIKVIKFIMCTLQQKNNGENGSDSYWDILFCKNALI